METENQQLGFVYSRAFKSADTTPSTVLTAVHSAMHNQPPGTEKQGQIIFKRL
jgi:hypothetical protein